MWIPAWSTSLGYATRLPYTVVQPTLARTPLVWGGFRSRVDALITDGTVFDWERVATAASQGNWRAINPNSGYANNFTLAFNRPTETTSGLGVLLSGAAAYYDTIDLVSDDLVQTEYRSWMQPVLESVPNFNTLGGSPAQSMASRGSALGEVALLPEADWLRNLRGSLINQNDPIVLSYPQFEFVFDFPMAVWSGELPLGVSFTHAQINTVVTQFASTLVSDSGQTAAQTFGLRPASDPVDVNSPLFTLGMSYGFLPDADLFTFISAPSLNDVQRLLTWAGGIIR